MKRLPRKLSALLLVAVTDAQKIQEDPRYVLNMSTYHQVTDDGKCHVCMAGAVMARRLECSPSETLSPSREFGNYQDRLIAIDSMRKGHFREAARLLSIDLTPAQLVAAERASCEVDYASVLGDNRPDDGNRAPWERYRAAAEILAAAGL